MLEKHSDYNIHNIKSWRSSETRYDPEMCSQSDDYVDWCIEEIEDLENIIVEMREYDT